MQLSPLLDEAHLGACETAPQHLARRDGDHNLFASVVGVEVGDAVLPHIHVDDMP